MDRKGYPVRIIRRDQDTEDQDPYLAQTTPQERLMMMWPLTIQAWAST